MFLSPGWIKLVKTQTSSAICSVLSPLQSGVNFSEADRTDGVGDRLTRIHTVKPVPLSGEEFIGFVQTTVLDLHRSKPLIWALV